MIAESYWFAVPALALAIWLVAAIIARHHPDSHCCWHCDAKHGQAHARGCPCGALE